MKQTAPGERPVWLSYIVNADERFFFVFLHGDFLEKETKTVSDNNLDRLACAYERLHKDYLYLEREYQILLAEKEQMSRTILEKNTIIWRMQIENERCRAEISRLSKESGQQ